MDRELEVSSSDESSVENKPTESKDEHGGDPSKSKLKHQLII